MTNPVRSSFRNQTGSKCRGKVRLKQREILRLLPYLIYVRVLGRRRKRIHQTGGVFREDQSLWGDFGRTR